MTIHANTQFPVSAVIIVLSNLSIISLYSLLSSSLFSLLPRKQRGWRCRLDTHTHRPQGPCHRCLPSSGVRSPAREEIKSSSKLKTNSNWKLTNLYYNTYLDAQADDFLPSMGLPLPYSLNLEKEISIINYNWNSLTFGLMASSTYLVDFISTERAKSIFSSGNIIGSIESLMSWKTWSTSLSQSAGA